MYEANEAYWADKQILLKEAEMSCTLLGRVLKFAVTDQQLVAPPTGSSECFVQWCLLVGPHATYKQKKKETRKK